MANSKTAKEIRAEMAALRAEMDVEVGAIAENAVALSDWRFYVRQYPWYCLSAAALAGYFMVPRRLELISPDADSLAQLAKQNRVVIKPQPEVPPKSPGRALTTFLANAAMRALLAYAGQKAGALLNSGTGDDGISGSPASPRHARRGGYGL